MALPHLRGKERMTSQASALRDIFWTIMALLILFLHVPVVGAQGSQDNVCTRTITANVVALDQPLMFNRLGASGPDGTIFALERDVVPMDYDPSSGQPPGPLEAGKVRLRADKRPRPLILRANVGDCLQINFRNLLLSQNPLSGQQNQDLVKQMTNRKLLLSPAPPSEQQNQELVNANNSITRYAGVHIMGLELVGSINSDSSWVGKNSNSLAQPGETKSYTYYARAEGTFLFDSGADPTGMQVNKGLFGAVNVQPAGAEWYRSQVTRTDLHQAACRVDIKTQELLDCPLTSLKPTNAVVSYEGKPYPLWQAVTMTLHRRTVQAAETIVTADGHLYGKTGHPIINYKAVYPQGTKYPSGQPIAVDTPILSMLQVKKTQQLGAPLNLPLSDYLNEIRNIERGFLPAKLQQAFAAPDRQIALSDKATITYNGGYQVVVTDQGKAYLAEVVKQGEQNHLIISQASFELIHGDLTAIITGPNADRFPYSQDIPSFRTNPALPDRRQPYREFSIFYHQPDASVVQAFPQYNTDNLRLALAQGADGFGINYGLAGIGSEILANRLGVGPMGNQDAVDLKYEEFFLSAWAVGDPAMVVDVPANANFQAVSNPE